MNKIQELLEKIARNTEVAHSDNETIWIALIAAGAVILGSSITAIVTYLVTNRTNKSQQQIELQRLKADVVSRERLRWLQDLRSRFSTLYAQMDMQYAQIKQPRTQAEIANFQQSLNVFSMEIMEQVNNLTVILNPKKPDQKELRDNLQEALAYMQQCFLATTSAGQTFDDVLYSNIKSRAFEAASAIGVKAWQKVQELE